MTRDDYARWWNDNTDADGELLTTLPEPVATLAAHVQELQLRIDRLMDPDEHDRRHGAGCRCYLSRCACAYDHPDAECMTHHAARVVHTRTDTEAVHCPVVADACPGDANGVQCTRPCLTAEEPA